FTIMGALGVTAAAISIEMVNWRVSCFGSGIFGLLLLLLRSVLFESRLFEQTAEQKIRRGSPRDLFGHWRNLKKFVACFLIMVPNWFITGILMTLAPEVAHAAGTQGLVKANIALAIYFASAALGDLLGATLSEKFKSRKSITAFFITGGAITSALLL